MTDNNHPITPPPELIQQWLGEYFGCIVNGEPSASERYLATQAARWGADQELEACCEWLLIANTNPTWATALQEARRPKPPSLKEQSLALIDKIQGDKEMWQTDELDVVRRALESLPS